MNSAGATVFEGLPGVDRDCRPRRSTRRLQRRRFGGSSCRVPERSGALALAKSVRPRPCAALVDRQGGDPENEKLHPDGLLPPIEDDDELENAEVVRPLPEGLPLAPGARSGLPLTRQPPRRSCRPVLPAGSALCAAGGVLRFNGTPAPLL